MNKSITKSAFDLDRLHNAAIAMANDDHSRVIGSMKLNPPWIQKEYLINRLEYLHFLLVDKHFEFEHHPEHIVSAYIAILCHVMYNNKGRRNRRLSMISSYFDYNGYGILERLNLSVADFGGIFTEVERAIGTAHYHKRTRHTYYRGGVVDLVVCAMRGSYDDLPKHLAAYYMEYHRPEFDPDVTLGLAHDTYCELLIEVHSSPSSWYSIALGERDLTEVISEVRSVTFDTIKPFIV